MKPRALAIHRGHDTYIGKPCKRGHMGARRVNSKACIECTTDNSRAYYAAHRERIRQRQKALARASGVLSRSEAALARQARARKAKGPHRGNAGSAQLVESRHENAADSYRVQG
jgi:hypothetical protein